MRAAISSVLAAIMSVMLAGCVSQAIAENPPEPVVRAVFDHVDDIGVSAKEKARRDVRADAALALRDLNRQREAERIEAEARATEAEAEQIAESYEVEEYTPVGYYYGSGYAGNDFKSQGVVWDGGVAYTWYSQNLLPGLDVDGKHVSDDGYVLDGQDRIVVASCDYPKGTELDTPFGTAVVLDYCPTSGVVDVYTDF